MPSESFSFPCVRGGKAIAASELPKLPPRASILMLERIKKAGLSPSKMTEIEAAPVLLEMMVDLVHLSLRRLEPGLSREALMDYADDDEVKACFVAIQAANPNLFPKSKPAPAGVASDPKPNPLAPAPSAPEPSAT